MIPFGTTRAVWRTSTHGHLARRTELVLRLRTLNVALLHPGHHGAEAGASLFKEMALVGLEKSAVIGLAGRVFSSPPLNEFARLDILESFLHALLDAPINDLWSDADIAPLGRLGNREAHAANAGFVDQVNDELHFMHALEVGHLR